MISQEKAVILRKGRARPFFGRHPWLFSGAVASVKGSPSAGDQVTVRSHEGLFVAYGLYNLKSQIRVRLYSWDPDKPLTEVFLKKRLDDALALREAIPGLMDPEGACRLVFSESDGLSGITVDRYGPYLALQVTSLALSSRLDLLLDHLEHRLRPRGIYLRTERAVKDEEGLELKDGLLRGCLKAGSLLIEEEGARYEVDLREGQKTGFYLDQRENRKAAARYAGGRTVLDLCCYSGGFFISSMKAGAACATGVDVSEAALCLAEKNAAHNDVSPVSLVRSDVFGFLEGALARGESYGMIIADPPRFTHRKRSLEQALKGYLRLNELAVKLLTPGGILVTCSCSGHISREDFLSVLSQVSERTGRPVRILEQRGQAPDHPVAASCPETSYLKCFICSVE
ncbi:MAG: class I SAM-dependent rRNA methyltransferase [Candidatus Eremiobacteraeota bacterium]|nr:class I SAM-dependent rRNA methyltransferase [Candidatus Eremiobacteraeota bacterium]